jgi:hypothetical protein
MATQPLLGWIRGSPIRLQGQGSSLQRHGPVLDRKYRIRRAVDDEKRGSDLVHPAIPSLAAFQRRVVCHARKVAGAIIVSLDEASQTRLVERMRRPRDLARILNHESDRLGPSSTRAASLATSSSA